MGTMFSITIGLEYLRIENCSMGLHLKQLPALYHLTLLPKAGLLCDLHCIHCVSVMRSEWSDLHLKWSENVY